MSMPVPSRAGAVLSVLALGAALLCGCAGRAGSTEAAELEGWIEQQEHVLAAESSTWDDPWSPGAAFTVEVEPRIRDDELTALVDDVTGEAAGGGWGTLFITWRLGDTLSFSNVGGAATVGVFTALRDEPSFTAFTARGDSACSAYCATLGTGEPRELLAAVHTMLAAADEVGGVQQNLPFTATDADGRHSVTAEPDAPSDEAVALWAELAASGSVELLSAAARSVQPMAGSEPPQLLEVTVADEASRAAAVELAGRRPGVELTVAVAEG
jgi:hypothetical protein